MGDRASECIARILVHEGGFVNNPKDPGGPTNRGVTLYTLRQLDIDVDGDGDVDIDDVRKLTEAEAITVYEHFYWKPPHCDLMPRGVDYFVVDTAVNSGVSRAGKILQKCLPGCVVDGWIGPNTIRILRGVNDIPGLIDKLCDNRLYFLQDLKTWPTFGKGWTSRVEDVRRMAKEDWARG